MLTPDPLIYERTIAFAGQFFRERLESCDYFPLANYAGANR